MTQVSARRAGPRTVIDSGGRNRYYVRQRGHFPRNMSPAGLAEAASRVSGGAERAKVVAALVPAKGAARKHRVGDKGGAVDSPAIRTMTMMGITGPAP